MRSKRYEIIVNDITNKIATGEFRVGQQIPVEAELTEKYGVSRITIQKAMSILVAQGYLKRISGKGTFVEQAVPTEKSTSNYRSLYYFVVPMTEVGIIDIIKGAQEIMMNRGHHLAINFFDNDPEREKETINTLLESGVKGLIVALWDSAKNREYYKQLFDEQIPLVFIDKGVYGITSNVVLSNNHDGMAKGMEYLIEMGHKRIGYVTFPLDIGTSLSDRMRAYTQTMRLHGLPFSRDMIVISRVHQAAFYEKMDRMLEKNPNMTAIMFASDTIASAFYEYAYARGIQIPEDISVCSFDGYDYTANLVPSLTTVRQNFFEIGTNAAKLLLEICAESENGGYRKSIYVPTNLIIRDSVKKIN